MKNWKLFLDILLVVGGIIAFTLWDPIGMFTNAKTKQTANLVTGVREIGQLVTAEYHGEVISSWKEFRLTEFPEDTLTEFADEAWQEIQYAVYGIWIEGQKSNKIKSRIQASDFYRTLPAKNAYPEFIAWLADKYLSKKLSKVYEGEQLKSGIDTKVYDALFKELKRKEKAINKKYKLRRPEEKLLYEQEVSDLQFETPGFENDFFSYYQFLVKQDIADEKRKNIVFIGRGSVKAGFDFGALNESNFLYDEEAKTISFFGIKPTILDADINPWFIPQRKVKGFELVAYSGKVNFEEAKEVKKQCKEKLLNQARKADIIRSAEENGKEALRNFFSLLLDEPDLKVSFHLHPYDRHMAILKADTLIDIQEALFIDSLYSNYKLQQSDTTKSVDFRRKSARLFAQMTDELKQLSFLRKEYPFNYYSVAVAKVLKDTFNIDSIDRTFLDSVRGKIVIDPEDSMNYSTDFVSSNEVWFANGDFRDEFNSTIELLNSEAIPEINLDELRYPLIIGDTTNYQPNARSAILKELMAVQLAIDRKEGFEKNVRPISEMRKSIVAFVDRLKK
ncbi:MAG: DUF4230 domain-containing protein [Cyclobacteriaceae bacterium]